MRTRFLVALLVVAVSFLAPIPMALGEPDTRLELLESPSDPGGEDIAFPASHLALRWSGADDAQVQVRWQVDGQWRPWQAAPVAHDLEDHRTGTVYSGLILAPGASRAQTRVVGAGARRVEVAAIDTRNGPRHLVRSRPATAGAAQGAATGPLPQPPVVTRAQWGADESLRKGTPLFAPVTKLVVHHTVTTNNDPDPAATVRAMYAFHTQVRGWDDLGYNFVVDPQGRIYEGRRARTYADGEIPTGEDLQRHGVVGAHAEGTNTGSAGIALMGDFTSVAPSPAAVSSLTSWLAWKAARHQIDPNGASTYTGTDGTANRVFANISGHRDVRATSCPGDQLYAMLPRIRQEVAQAAAVRLPRGYWIAGRDGAVHALGAAPFLGDARAARLTQPIRGMTATAAQRGYWLLGGDGGIFAYGDAAFHGSTGAIKLNQPVVGMAPTPTGLGYWLVASDGGIFAFGDARFAGSTGALALNSPIVAMEAVSDGSGYWLIARDGGVFAFTAPYHGSVPGLRLASYAGSAGLRAMRGAQGYYVLGTDGGLFTFGQARFFGSKPGLSGPSAAAGLAVFDVIA